MIAVELQTTTYIDLGNLSKVLWSKWLFKIKMHRQFIDLNDIIVKKSHSIYCTADFRLDIIIFLSGPSEQKVLTQAGHLQIRYM